MVKRVYTLNPALIAVMTAVVLMVCTTSAHADEKSDIIQLVNAYRASLGLHTLQLNPALNAAAQNQANFLAETGLYTHSGYGGSQPNGRAIAAGYNGQVSENFVAGFSATPQWGVNWWKNSYIHNYNMTRFRFTQAGVGYAYGHEQHWYVLVFGDPAGGTNGGRLQVAVPQRVESESQQNQPTNQQVVSQNETVERTVPVIPAVKQSKPEADGSAWHMMESGQALWTVAMVNGVTVDDLLLYNNLRENDFVPSGRRIKVRLADNEPVPTPAVFHTASAGESLWAISRAYGVDYDYLLSLNGFPNDIALDEGDEIRVRLLDGESLPPMPPTLTPTPITYAIVQSGQTGFDIAVAAGISLAELWEWNNLDRNDLIYPGDKLLIVPPTSIQEPSTSTPAPTNTATPRPTKTATPEPTATLIVLAQLDEPTETPQPIATAESEPDVSTTDIIVAEIADATQSDPPQMMQSSMGFVGSLNDTLLGVIALGMIIAAAIIRVV